MENQLKLKRTLII